MVSILFLNFCHKNKKSLNHRGHREVKMKFDCNNQAVASPKRPEIDYPCTWVYKVIGQDHTLLKEVIITACAPEDVTISHSNTSSGGKYHSLNAELTVKDETTRLAIYESLKCHPMVKLVL